MNISFYKIIVLTLILLYDFQPWCQAQGEIRFGIDLEGELRKDKRYFEIQLEDTLLINVSHAQLPVGYYTGEVWSPGFDRKEISFEIVENQRTDLMVYMNYSEEYITYQKELPGYIKKGRRLKTIPLIFTSLFTVGTVFAIERMTTYERKIYLGVDNYPKTTSVSNMHQLKSEMYLNSEKYNRYRAYFYSGIALTGISVVAAIWGTRYFNRKIVKPTYNKVSPFRSELVLELGLTKFNLILRI